MITTALLLVLGSAQHVTGAQIVITISGDSLADVDAVFEFEDERPFAATLYRLPDQDLTVTSMGDVDASFRRGLVRLTGASSARVEVSYKVRGAVRRVPLPVPTHPVIAGGSVNILVTGLPEGVPADDAFPRLTPEARGASATLRDIPGLVRLPRADGASVGHIAERSVLLLVGLVSLGWIVRERIRIRARGAR